MHSPFGHRLYKTSRLPCFWKVWQFWIFTQCKSGAHIFWKKKRVLQVERGPGWSDICPDTVAVVVQNMVQKRCQDFVQTPSGWCNFVNLWQIIYLFDMFNFFFQVAFETMWLPTCKSNVHYIIKIILILHYMYSTSDNCSTSLTSSSESLMTSSTTICTSCLKMLFNFGMIHCWTSWQSTKKIPFSVQKLFVMLDTCSLQVLIWFSCCCNVINKHFMSLLQHCRCTWQCITV